MPRRNIKSSNRFASKKNNLPNYLRTLNLSPQKTLGQHFLIDQMIMFDIAAAVDQKDIGTVIEIGAGPGGLTQELVKNFLSVIAVEIDEELASITRERLRDYDNLTVIAADILQVDLLEILLEAEARPPFVVVGNLPYYITQPILRKMQESTVLPSRIVILVQREVGRRIVGGTWKESFLSMCTKFFGSPQKLFDVDSSSFWPEPKVQSSVIQIDNFSEPSVPVLSEDRESFFHLLRAGFSSPRKQLHNVLPGALGISAEEIKLVLNNADIAPDLRAQHLSLEDWYLLFCVLQNSHPMAMKVR